MPDRTDRPDPARSDPHGKEGPLLHIDSPARAPGRRRLPTATLTVLGLIAVGLGAIVMTSVYDLHPVRTATMAPTVGASAIGAYEPLDGAQVRRGDIVRFSNPWPEAEGFGPSTFRVIGVGGDRLVGDDKGRMTLNGSALPEPYVARADSVAQAPFDVTVPKGRVFVAGDARTVANDSRLHIEDENSGTVAVDAISSRLVGVSWPAWNWAVVDSPRAIPWAFVAASISVAVGSLFLAAVAVRALRFAFHRARGWRRTRRRTASP